ncbi:MAG: class I SAM-dependent methyltransferase [Calditrichaeota bacterium]|nr:MAG: class I SAM-dependent methyltransferase [Calditrichota bacterium]
MKMSRLEKRLVNREAKARFNIELLRQRLAEMDQEVIYDVLEIGCGVGYVSAYLAIECGMKVVGSDFDPEQIEIARRIHDQNDLLQFRVQDASHLDFPNESFDLVISQHVFHHVSAWQKIVKETARVLRPAGYFIWLDLALPAMAKKLIRPLSRKYGVYTFGEIKDEMNQYGLYQVFYEKLRRWLFVSHHLVVRKQKGKEE